MGSARKRIDQFLDGLNDREIDLLLRKWRGHTLGRSVSHEEYIALNCDPEPPRNYTREETAAFAAHAEAVTALGGAFTFFMDAMADLRRAENRRGPELANGSRPRTSSQEDEIERLAQVVEDAKAAWEAAGAAEVAMRPYNQTKTRRRGLASFPLLGKIVRADGRPEQPIYPSLGTIREPEHAMEERS